MSAAFRRASLLNTLPRSRLTSRPASSRSLQTFSRFTSYPSPSTSTLRSFPSSSPQRRAFSLWPSGASPAPIIGSDGKLVEKRADQGAAESAVAPPAQTSTPVDFQKPPADAASPLSPSSTPTPASDHLGSASLESLPPELAESVAETRRTLAEYDLGGSGFTGKIQELLEWTHLTTGLPWYLTIGAVVVSIRLLIFPLMVNGIANNARLAHIQPRMLANINKIKQAKAEGNTIEAQRLQIETKDLMVDNNCTPWKGLAPPLLQMPLFIFFFLALRNMANAGLPDFATGGAAWFMNLSSPDPYYVLPALSSLATLAVLQVGEFGAPEAQGPAKTVRNVIKLCIPIIFIVTAKFPAGVLVYWVTHNTFSILQALVLRLPGFKRWANIPDPPKRDPATKTKSLGFWEAFQDTKNAFSDQVAEAKSRTEQSQEKKAAEKRERDRQAEIAERKKAALEKYNAGKDTARVEQVSPPKTEGNVTSATFAIKDEQLASTPEDAKKHRVAEARRRRETQRTRKSRF